MTSKNFTFNGVSLAVTWDEKDTVEIYTKSYGFTYFNVNERIAQIKHLRQLVHEFGNVATVGLKESKDFVDSYYFALGISPAKVGLRLVFDLLNNGIEFYYGGSYNGRSAMAAAQARLESLYGFNKEQALVVVNITIATGEVCFPKLQSRSEPTRWYVKYEFDYNEWAIIAKVGDEFKFEDGYNLGQKSTSIRFPDHTTALTFLSGKWNLPCQSLIIEAVR